MTKRKIIIDTDPGTDDAIALLLAAASGTKIAALVSSFGNVPLKTADKNLRALASLLKLDGKLVCGAECPFESVPTTAEHVHGGNGIGNVVIPDGRKPDASGTKAIYEALSPDEKTDYIALGPLTNLAKLITEFPDAVGRIGRTVIMGGGFNEANMPGGAEFNIHCDPKAASIVFSSALKIEMMPLDVTNHMLVRHGEIAALPDSGAAGVMKRILLYNADCCEGMSFGGAAMHDGAAVLMYLFPEKFDVECGTVTVDSHGATKRSQGDSTVFAVRGDREFTVKKIAEAFYYIGGNNE